MQVKFTRIYRRGGSSHEVARMAILFGRLVLSGIQQDVVGRTGHSQLQTTKFLIEKFEKVYDFQKL